MHSQQPNREYACNTPTIQLPAQPLKARNLRLAFKHFNESAFGGSSDGMFNLASMLCKPDYQATFRPRCSLCPFSPGTSQALARSRASRRPCCTTRRCAKFSRKQKLSSLPPLHDEALDRGHTPAAYSLAVMHLNGIGAQPSSSFQVPHRSLSRGC